MNFTTYILYSSELKKYYTGFTAMKIEERMKKHLSNHRGYTGKAKDWRIIYEQSFEDKLEAMKLENKIKKRGAKRYLIDQGIV